MSKSPPPETASKTGHFERRRSRGGAPRLALDLISIAPVFEPAAVALRREQVRQVVRASPRVQLFMLVTVMLVAFELRHNVSPMALASWLLAVLALACIRFTHARRIQRNLAQSLPPHIFRDLLILTVGAALLWDIPAFLWSPNLPFRAQIMIGMVLLGVMCSGAISLALVPPAALAFVGLVAAGQVYMATYHASIAVTSLAMAMPILIAQSIIGTARMFVRQVKAHGELEEQGQLISLLREFQSSGSDWLWELDPDLRIRYLSQGMADSIGLPTAKLIGMSARRLIDPNQQHSLLSEGTRALFSSIASEQPFHEIAFPTIDGKQWYCMSGRPLRDEAGTVIGWRGVASDITGQRIGTGTESIKIARRDTLTGLANRLLVREWIEEARLRQRSGSGHCVLLLLDLDRFKMVNDTLGHAVGDLLLIEVAARLKSACGENAGVGRLGGDEFAIVWRGASDTLTLIKLADAISAEIERGFTIGPSAIHVGVSIGIARAPFDGESQDQLMRSADLALYRAKEQGRGHFAFYEPWMLAKAQADRLLENDVREAVRRGELHLAYQPILDSTTMAVVGHEALLRWSHPQRGSIAPDVFVPIIEDVGLIHQIGGWVIAEACREAATWPDARRIAVNVSVAQLTAAGLRETVEHALQNSGLAPGRLELEVTESVFMGDDAATLAALASLQALGVRLVLDDFGKGYSSFGYLSRARFAKIKIDQLFVRAAAHGQRESMAIIESILALAKGLGVETTAEGIETHAQAQLMIHLGCSQLQGFLFGRPVTPEAMQLMRRREGETMLPLRLSA